MDVYVGYIASAATMLAAMMTAANLGSRVTGWGFVVFVIGSIAWSTVGFLTDQTSLMVTNAFLLLVNLFGVWRWLGRQARYEDGSAKASRRSRRTTSGATLFSGGTLIGHKVHDREGVAIGTLIDLMVSCEGKQIVYAVIAEGGMAGAGERLRAVHPALLQITDDAVLCRLRFAEFCAIPEIDPEQWPEQVPEQPDQ
ncbi:PRC-barrel domain-containing protein [Erythrobacter sp. R86502]|uniref:PRC-barrel domain containing protein n=1 Tax=Erythrobacter sp. R86502 TaxID=3093846 RepID=UPI0036D41A3D